MHFRIKCVFSFFGEITRLGQISRDTPCQIQQSKEMKSILRVLLLCFLILTREIRGSSLLSDVEENEKSKSDFQSPTSTVFINDSPDLVTRKRSLSIFRPKDPENLQDLSASVLLYIGEFLEFSHRDLGGLNKYLREVFSKITPSHVISNQIGIPRLRNLPKCPDLKYLIGGILNEKNLNVEESFLMTIMDVALLKTLPNIKGPLIRFLYDSAVNNPAFPRQKLLETIHPFKMSYSPMTAILQVAFYSKDFSFVFDIWERFPEMRPNDDGAQLFTRDLILAAIEMEIIEKLFTQYACELSLQQKYNLMCNILSETSDPSVLEMFMEEAYRPVEKWNPNYTETFLNAWIYALTRSSEKGCFQAKIESLNELVQLIETRVSSSYNTHVAIRKLTLLLLINIRSGVVADITDMLNSMASFPIDAFQFHHEVILWVLVVEERFIEFFAFLTQLHLQVFETSWLRTTISKSKSSEFINELIRSFNVNRLFSNNLYGEAYHNKRLFLHLTGYKDEANYLRNCLIDKNLFEYAQEHFSVEEWESFLRLRSQWTAVAFSNLIAFIFKNKKDNSRQADILKNINQLLADGIIRIISWGRPDIHLTIDEINFILSDRELTDLVKSLNRFIQFRSDSSIYLLSSEISSIIHFDGNDLLLQIPYYDGRIDHVENSLKRAMKTLKELNLHLMDQDQLDTAILYHFNPILSKLSPIDYLYVLPYALLKKVIVNDPDRMKKALMTVKPSQESKLAVVFNSLRGNNLKIHGPFVPSSNIRKLLRSYQVSLEII